MSSAACPEILAPAGDVERLHAAVLYGADAVYLAGKQFGMRSAPPNFSVEELRQAVAFCHQNNTKVYLTCNTLPTNEEVDRLPEYIIQAADAGVDAVIVADVGVLLLAKRVAPELSVHVSTQAGVVNYLTARELYYMGASRVILARELSLEAISTIRDKTPPELEIEAFVHGAMCMGFSGRCLLSQYLTHRDSNRGQCSQPCRWGYYVVEEKRPGQYFPLYEDENGSYIFNAQDLSMLPYLDHLARAGIGSFKIEGRAKSAYYVAVVTNAYRMAVDLYWKDPHRYQVPEWLLEEICKVSHREYSTGFYFPQQPPGQYYKCRGYVRQWDVVAVVERWEDGQLFCTSRNRFAVGETVEILSPGQKPVAFVIPDMVDEEDLPVPVARHPMMLLKMPCQQRFPAGSILRRQREESQKE